MDRRKIFLISAGAITGFAAVILTMLGNPANMGFCVACFIRDIAGAAKLHTAGAVQYVRPEIIGIIIGALGVSMLKGEFKPRGGSSPVIRFVLGFGVMVGALMFLGCPLRMALRIGGGDLNAIVGLLGFAVGILIGVFFLNRGFSLGRSHKQPAVEGLGISILGLILLLGSILVPALFALSTEGPGSMRAPLLAALAAGLLVGALAQRSRFCMMGGVRDLLMFKDATLLLGFIALIIVAVIGNLVMGSFKLGFAEQPVAHSDGIWNFLGMLTVGLGSVMLGGCPLRQLVLAGEGSSDSAAAVLGMLVGAAFCHNFSLASSANGATANGKIAVCVVIVIMLIIALGNLERRKD